MIYNILKEILKKQNNIRKKNDCDYEYYKAHKLNEQGDIKSCLHKLQEILAEFPSHRDSLGLYAFILLNNQKFKPSYTLAQELSYKNPEMSAAWMILAVAAKDKGYLDEALMATKKAIEFDGNASLHSYAAVLCLEMANHQEAFAYFDAAHDLHSDEFVYSSSKLFAMTCSNEIEYEDLMRAHLQWGESVESVTPCFQHANHKFNQKLRLGFVSSDFKNHPVSTLIIPFLENVNKNQFDTICFHCHAGEADEYTERIKNLASQWCECVSMDDFQLAKYIYTQKIDILFDLSGHTSGHKLVMFAMKPAPIQISWFGYMNTTGLKRIDYRITDPYTIPQNSAKYYSEKILSMDVVDTWLPHPEYPGLTDLPAIKNGFITFGSFNRWWKITDSILESWSIILKKVDKSKLKIITTGAEDEAFRKMVFEKFEKHDIHSERVILLPTMNMVDFYNEVAGVDISFDTFPYNGGTTSLNTVWMGVPFVTMKGKSEVSRSGYALCANLDLKDYCVETYPAYIDAAIKLTTNLERLRYLRENLREMLSNSKLMNHEMFARRLEKSLRKLVSERSR